MFPAHPCYDDGKHELELRSEIANNDPVDKDESMPEELLVAELLREAKAAHRAMTAYEQHAKRVKELLPAVRAKNVKRYGPAQLEGMIGKLYDRGTISRLTAERVGTSKPKPAQDNDA